MCYRSYDKAKRQLTALDSEVIVLKKTRQMLEQQKDKDKEGLEIKFSAIESLEELEHQIEQTSQLLKQRKGELAPQVASLKAKRKELQVNSVYIIAMSDCFEDIGNEYGSCWKSWNPIRDKRDSSKGIGTGQRKNS